MNPKQKLADIRPMLGCDPELFFAAPSGEVIGSERVLPETPLETTYHSVRSMLMPKRHGIVMDGVQVELNPNPHTCRANLVNELSYHFRTLKTHLGKMKDVRVSFKTVVEVSEEEMSKLSERSRQLGCAPSLNAHDTQATISVDPATYRTRSAGGHIHLGLQPGSSTMWAYSPEKVYAARERIVPIMDILVGLPSVFIDRDPQAAERRKVYGRAGEYRLPAHGLEYRTLSNFWLRNSALMSFVLGMSRTAVAVVYQTEICRNAEARGYNTSWDAEKELLGLVDLDKVREAINTNSLALAKECWPNVEKYLAYHVLTTESGIHASYIENFRHFTQMIEEKGIEFWFPEDPLEHWTNLSDGHGRGFEAFIGPLGPVQRDRLIYEGKPPIFED